jgi:hypothetical protein
MNRESEVKMNRESEVKSSGIPYLAKNERDMGHPSLVRGRDPRGLSFQSYWLHVRDGSNF